MKQLLASFTVLLPLSLWISACGKNGSSSTQPPSSPAQGITVHLNSDPSGASIDLDGGTTGKTTPYTFTNLSTGTHRFRIYRNEDYSELDTSLYLQESDVRTITAHISPLWNLAWTGSQFVGSMVVDNVSYDYSLWGAPFDSMRVPTTLNARMTITYTDERCGSSPDPAYVQIGNTTIAIAASPAVIQTGSGLSPGQGGKIRFGYSGGASCDQFSNCCVNGIVIKSIALETY